MITDATRAAARAAGIPDSSKCWKPSSKEAGADPGEAKQYLRTILCPQDGDNYGGKGAEGTIQGLDGQFAVCAAKFLKAAKQEGINVCIREGARTVEKQQQYVARGVIACKKGAMCEHPRGIAIDVNVRPNVNDCKSYARLHASGPSFGVHFYLKCKDAYHFVPMPGGSCNGGGVIQPQKDYDFPQYYSSPTPTAGIANQFRQALGMQPSQIAQPAQQPITSIPNTPIGQQTPQPELPQPTQSQFCLPDYKCSGSTLMFQNSFCATQAVQVCSRGCANGACIAPSATTTQASTTSPTTSNNDVIVEKPRASTTLEILEFLSGKESTIVEVGTSTPLQLLLSLTGDQVTTIAPTSTQSQVQPQSQSQSQSTSSVLGNAQYMTAQQTFISGDLKDYVSLSQQPPRQNNSALFALLEQLKQLLLWMLNYLQPFELSRTRSSNISIDGHVVTQ